MWQTERIDTVLKGKVEGLQFVLEDNNGIKKLQPQTWRSSLSLCWMNALHCPELWQEWTGSTDNGS